MLRMSILPDRSECSQMASASFPTGGPHLLTRALANGLINHDYRIRAGCDPKNERRLPFSTAD
jgi:hypothetical protein